MNKNKAKMAAGVFCATFFLMLALLAKLAPWALVWILWTFAVPGVFKFCRVTYIWLLGMAEPAAEKQEGAHEQTD